MNNNKYIPAHHWHDGNTEIYDFEQFKKVLLDKIDREIKRVKNTFSSSYKPKHIPFVCELYYLKGEFIEVKTFEELVIFYDELISDEQFEFFDMTIGSVKSLEVI